MSGFDFPSAPGRNVIQNSLRDAATLQWSLNTLFGNDPTTLAIKQQTAMMNKQQQYERNLNIVNNVYLKCVELLDQVLANIEEVNLGDYPDYLSLSFLNDEHFQCSNNVEEFHNSLVQILGAGNFKGASKYYAQNINAVVEPLAMLVAKSDSFKNIARMLVDQLLEGCDVFHTIEVYKELDSGYNGRWQTVLDKYSKLKEMGYPKIKELGQEIDELAAIGQPNTDKYIQNFQKCENLISETERCWNKMVAGEQMSEEDQLSIATLLTELLSEVSAWKIENEKIRNQIQKLEDKLSNVSLAIDPNSIKDEVQVSKSESVLDAISKLNDLRLAGALTNEEFEFEKRKLLERL
jgi:hypothetical protein